MELNALTAISPIDGRYLTKTAVLQPLFSEFALMKYRLYVEIKWLKALANCNEITEISSLPRTGVDFFDTLYTQFCLDDAKCIKAIENVTNHDVKAIEYFLKQQMSTLPELAPYKEFVHFACTSADINNLAYGLMLKNTREQILQPLMQQLIEDLRQLAHCYAEQPMLARTHGQAAIPTTMGKEIANFVARLQREYDSFIIAPIYGKMNGAVGNFNAHRCAYEHIDWQQFTKDFIEGLGIKYNVYTTQIEQHDYIANLFDALARFNTVLIDFNRDIWGYISLGYFKQKAIAGEVGSSTMPHKVNPIDFENAEGNLLLANTLLKFLGDKLCTSRWQRDLIDSTLLRNLGVGIAHTLVAYQAALKGISKLELDDKQLDADLAKNWQVLAEPIQIIMRCHGIEEPYEKLKALTRGKEIGADDIATFIEKLDIPKNAKKKLLRLTPYNYLGLSAELAKSI